MRAWARLPSEREIEAVGAGACACSVVVDSGPEKLTQIIDSVGSSWLKRLPCSSGSWSRFWSGDHS